MVMIHLPRFADDVVLEVFSVMLKAWLANYAAQLVSGWSGDRVDPSRAMAAAHAAARGWLGNDDNWKQFYSAVVETDGRRIIQ